MEDMAEPSNGFVFRQGTRATHTYMNALARLKFGVQVELNENKQTTDRPKGYTRCE